MITFDDIQELSILKYRAGFPWKPSVGAMIEAGTRRILRMKPVDARDVKNLRSSNAEIDPKLRFEHCCIGKQSRPDVIWLLELDRP